MCKVTIVHLCPSCDKFCVQTLVIKFEEYNCHLLIYLLYISRQSKFLAYLEKLYSRREIWALSFRKTLLTRGNNTNNFVEAAMRIMKDVLLERTAAFNLPQLFDLLSSGMESYYITRLTSVALGQPTRVQRSRFLPAYKKVNSCDIRQVIFPFSSAMCSLCVCSLSFL